MCSTCSSRSSWTLSPRSGATPPARPFPRLTYADAIMRYGTDKPDLRFGLEIQDATEVTRGSEFGVFAGAETRPLPRRARGVLARRARSGSRRSRRSGARRDSPTSSYDGDEVRSPIAKFLSEEELEAFRGAARLDRALRRRRRGARSRACSAACASTSVASSSSRPTRSSSTGSSTSRSSSATSETGDWTFLHHPFTAPIAGRRGPASRATPEPR